LEPTGSATARNTKNEMAEKRGGRGEERRKDPERAESLSKEYNPLALLRRGLMLWKRAIGSNEMNDDSEK
jgi:general stress protein YciG